MTDLYRPLIVFDWNGTILADTLASWHASNACLAFYGAGPISLARYRATASFPILHFYAKNGVSVDRVLALKGNTFFQKEYERLAARARTRAGVRGLLTWLHTQGLPCIILSNYVTRRIAEQVERLGLAPYFQHIDAHEGDGGQIVEYTSKMERLCAYMQKRRYTPGHSIIIGDSTEEPAVARALGLTSIAITGGSFSDAQIAHAKPNYTIGHMSQAQDLIEHILTTLH